jgi:hypothetical protein
MVRGRSHCWQGSESSDDLVHRILISSSIDRLRLSPIRYKAGPSAAVALQQATIGLQLPESKVPDPNELMVSSR